MVFGPFFWSIAVLNRLLATILAFVLSWAVGIWLVWTGLREKPGKLAKFMLDRLMLGHKTLEIRKREESIRRKIISAVSALAVTPLIGGVIPSLVLNRHQLMEVKDLKKFSVLLCGVYAVEFAALHGGWGLGGLFRAIVT